jgi:hypothetical protein
LPSAWDDLYFDPSDPQIHADPFCARALDPLVGGEGFDFVLDLGAIIG